MSDQTNVQREHVARDLADERDRTARDLAIEEGRRRERVDGKLQSHENRLNAINGSVRRGAEATETNARATVKLGEKIDGIAAAHRRQEEIRGAREDERNKIDRERTAALEKAQASQISRRMLIVAVVGLIATIVVVGLALAVFIVTRGHSS